jgi:flavin-dependent dehydrogenase
VASLDALVIGGGPAGATAACLLAQQGWSVAIVESKAFPRRKVCGEYLSATNLPLLQQLGVAEEFCEMAGSPVTETAVYAGRSQAMAPLPRISSSSAIRGRALSRERLDVLLLENAARAGTQIMQPYRCTAVSPEVQGFRVQLVANQADEITELHAKSVIAAHGSWDHGELATQRRPSVASAHDWLAFKAHFRQSVLPAGLMPLLSFPDGYGGMVHCDNGLVSLSCCIQRRRLSQLPREPGRSAGEAVFDHIRNSTPALQPILETATAVAPWLSVGPLQTGFRRCYQNGMFLIGNAAGEAHPVVAEGISMAMQSAWLLVEEMALQREKIERADVRESIAKRYSAAWRRSFLPRIRFAAAVAQWAKRPALVAAMVPWLRQWPGVLTWGAGLSGKDRLVVKYG